MKKNKKFTKVLFPKSINLGKRNWGTEDLLVVIPKILSLKILKIQKGKRGGLQYHHLKNECGYILSGKLLIRYDNGNGVLKEKILTKGKCFHFPPGAVHQEEAITNVKILEASTPHFNDRVRVESLYNLNAESGLPTTNIKDVKVR
jgi:mannose-6-phosphate isomerase-like protein (cupin superfamily)